MTWRLLHLFFLLFYRVVTWIKWELNTERMNIFVLKLVASKNDTHLLCRTVAVGQKSGGSSAEWLRFEDAHEVAVRTAARTVSAEGGMGAWGSVSQMIRSHGWQVDGDFWWEAFSSLPRGPLGRTAWVFSWHPAGFPQHRLSLGYVSQLYSVWKGLHRNTNTGVKTHWCHPRSHLISWILQMSSDVLFYLRILL